MKTAWTEDAWQDYLYWQQEDEKILTAINDLIKDIKRDPFKGLGKPEPLKHALQGWWSRRISGEHRLVYRAREERRSATRYHSMPLSLLIPPGCSINGWQHVQGAPSFRGSPQG
jgi:toxin YoeB